MRVAQPSGFQEAFYPIEEQIAHTKKALSAELLTTQRSTLMLGAEGGIRTRDLTIMSRLLYR